MNSNDLAKRICIWTQRVVASISLFLFSGCASIMTHTQQSPEGKGAYSGVRADVSVLAHPNSVGDAVIGHVSPAIIVPCGIIDMPLSAALDTLLLPIDLTYREPKTAENEHPKEPQQ